MALMSSAASRCALSSNASAIIHEPGDGLEFQARRQGHDRAFEVHEQFGLEAMDVADLALASSW